MKKALLFLLMAAGITVAEAQQLSRFRPNEETRLVLEKPAPRVVKAKPGETAPEPDYVLYREITRRYSWIVGKGDPITQEVADHLPYYFKLALKNAKGHWQHIQAMHGDSLTSDHGQGTYILDPESDTSDENREWRDKLAKVCQWYITSDLSGEQVAEERAYDKNNYMIYGFQPIRNGRNRVVASYTNDYGYPVDIAESGNYAYGNVVMITYDRHGYDSIIDYLDGAGFRRLNNDGVDQRQYTYDEKGRVLRSSSNNAVGDYMIDNWGNCGNVYEYDDAGNSYTITRVDQEMRPMRMPEGRAGKLETYIRCLVKLDKWGRKQEMVFLDAGGNPDTTLAGIHRVVYEYSDTGELLGETFYDLDNDPLTF